MGRPFRTVTPNHRNAWKRKPAPPMPKLAIVPTAKMTRPQLIDDLSRRGIPYGITIDNRLLVWDGERFGEMK